MITGVDDTVAAQACVLAARGLDAAPAHRISTPRLSDLKPLSVLSEGCVIFNLAFVAAILLWFVLGGLAWLLRAWTRSTTRSAR